MSESIESGSESEEQNPEPIYPNELDFENGNDRSDDQPFEREMSEQDQKITEGTSTLESTVAKYESNEEWKATEDNGQEFQTRIDHNTFEMYVTDPSGVETNISQQILQLRGRGEYEQHMGENQELLGGKIIEQLTTITEHRSDLVRDEGRFQVLAETKFATIKYLDGEQNVIFKTYKNEKEKDEASLERFSESDFVETAHPKSDTALEDPAPLVIDLDGFFSKQPEQPARLFSFLEKNAANNITERAGEEEEKAQTTAVSFTRQLEPAAAQPVPEILASNTLPFSDSEPELARDEYFGTALPAQKKSPAEILEQPYSPSMYGSTAVSETGIKISLETDVSFSDAEKAFFPETFASVKETNLTLAAETPRFTNEAAPTLEQLPNDSKTGVIETTGNEQTVTVLFKNFSATEAASSVFLKPSGLEAVSKEGPVLPADRLEASSPQSPSGTPDNLIKIKAVDINRPATQNPTRKITPVPFRAPTTQPGTKEREPIHQPVITRPFLQKQPSIESVAQYIQIPVAEKIADSLTESLGRAAESILPKAAEQEGFLGTITAEQANRNIAGRSAKQNSQRPAPATTKHETPVMPLSIVVNENTIKYEPAKTDIVPIFLERAPRTAEIHDLPANQTAAKSKEAISVQAVVLQPGITANLRRQAVETKTPGLKQSPLSIESGGVTRIAEPGPRPALERNAGAQKTELPRESMPARPTLRRETADTPQLTKRTAVRNNTPIERNESSERPSALRQAPAEPKNPNAPERVISSAESGRRPAAETITPARQTTARRGPAAKQNSNPTRRHRVETDRQRTGTASISNQDQLEIPDETLRQQIPAYARAA